MYKFDFKQIEEVKKTKNTGYRYMYSVIGPICGITTTENHKKIIFDRIQKIFLCFEESDDECLAIN